MFVQIHLKNLIQINFTDKANELIQNIVRSPVVSFNQEGLEYPSYWKYQF